MNRLFAEACGTFALVFAGTGAIVVNEATHGSIGHAGIALTFGLVVLAMIAALGDISGAHLNPAVSIAFVVARRFPASSLPGYVLAQCVGAFAASALLRLLFPENASLGATLPAGPGAQSFILEIVITCILMLVILSVSTRAKERGTPASISIGATVALAAMFAGPISGASMNPARSLAPALVTGNFSFLWIYLAAPVVGAAFAVAVHALLRQAKPANAHANAEGA
ncbi:MAG: MIP/aquaporin family protein [Phycisphaerales bacterium]